MRKFLVALGCIAVLVGIVKAFDVVSFLTKARVAQAKVVRFHPEHYQRSYEGGKWNRGGIRNIYLNFPIALYRNSAGMTLEVHKLNPFKIYQMGDEFSVLYDESHSQISYENSFWAIWTLPLFWLISGLTIVWRFSRLNKNSHIHGR